MSEFLQYSAEQPLSGPLLVELIRTVLARGLPFRFQAGGSSMFPFIRDGDILSIAPLPQNGPGLGAVVAFEEREKVIVHRVVRKTAAGWVIQGDNCPPERGGRGVESVPPERLLGMVASIERKGRNVRLSLGPERGLVAVCSRAGALVPLMRFAACVYRPIKSMILLANWA